MNKVISIPRSMVFNCQRYESKIFGDYAVELVLDNLHLLVTYDCYYEDSISFKLDVITIHSVTTTEDLSCLLEYTKGCSDLDEVLLEKCSEDYTARLNEQDMIMRSVSSFEDIHYL